MAMIFVTFGMNSASAVRCSGGHENSFFFSTGMASAGKPTRAFASVEALVVF
jgi:hypothetical protein